VLQEHSGGAPERFMALDQGSARAQRGSEPGFPPPRAAMQGAYGISRTPLQKPVVSAVKDD